MDRNVKIFSGTSECRLAEKIAKKLDMPLGKAKILKFQDGEYYTKIDESVRGDDVFIVQSTSMPVNENIMGLLIFIDAIKRASAKTLNIIMPYYGYARQDRKASPREPITAKLIANLLTTAGATRIITMDLHSHQVQGFFDIPLEHLEGLPLLANTLIDNKLYGSDVVVVAPNTGVAKKARKLAEWMDCSIALTDRRHSESGLETIDLIGDVTNKKVVLIDDMIVTGKTIISAAETAVREGATEVYAASSHGVFSGDAIEKLELSPIKRIYISDSIHLTEDKKIDKIEVVSVDTLFSEVLKRVIKNESLMSLLEK